jgi:hypothetical protein
MSLANFRPCLCGLLALMFAVPQSLYAETHHVVTTAELQSKVVQPSQVREQNQKTLRSFLSSWEVQKAMRSAHINAQQVETAIPSLSDAELAQLAARASHAQKDFAAGALSREALLIIAIAVVVVIIVVAVKA